MKTIHRSFRLKMSLALWAGMVCCFSSIGQSGAGGAPAILSRTYDTLLTGFGYSNYNLTFPQWDPQTGTLAAVRIRALVTVQYGFTLKNVDVVPSTYTIIAGREDAFSSPAMAVAYDNIFEQKVGSWLLNPGGVQSQLPFPVLNQYNNTDSITGNIAGFMGTGTFSLSYSPITYTDIRTDNNSSYSFRANVHDTTHFSVTYFYSPSGVVLATGLMGFTATLQPPGLVQLVWTAANETAGRQYVVEASRDGLFFAGVSESMPSALRSGAVDYQYPYKLPSGSQGKWYFRIRITGADGTIDYSVIREVTVVVDPGGGVGAGSSGMILYPNPAADFVNLSFADPVLRDWQVEIYSADGRLIQRNDYLQSGNILVNFPFKLVPGTYFVRATDRQSSRSLVAPLMVR
jgi:type IX secretion system substrate protein